MASGETATAVTSDVPQLPNHKVKIKKTGQRAYNEKNEKGKFCGGHLKRWFYAADVIEKECGCVEKAWGANTEVYRCEFCQTLVFACSRRSPWHERGRQRPAVNIWTDRTSQGVGQVSGVRSQVSGLVP